MNFSGWAFFFKKKIIKIIFIFYTKQIPARARGTRTNTSYFMDVNKFKISLNVFSVIFLVQMPSYALPVLYIN